MSTELHTGSRVNIYNRQGTRIAQEHVSKATKTFLIVNGVKYRRKPVKGKEIRTAGRGWRVVGAHRALTAMDGSGRFLRCALDEERRALLIECEQLVRGLGRFSHGQLRDLQHTLRDMDAHLARMKGGEA